jgi:hypothetical protein
MKVAGLLAVFLLTGCLLNQRDPAVAAVRPLLLGVVSAEEMTVTNQGELAVFSAEFAMKSEVKPPLEEGPRTLRALSDRQNAIHELMGVRSRVPACKKILREKKPASTPPAKNPSALERVGLGTLGFGPALQQTLLLIQPGKDKRYSMALNSRLPSGAYQLVSNGTEDTDPLSEILSMPEEVRYLRMNNEYFGAKSYSWDPTKGLDIKWREPGIVNDQNGILIEAMVEDAKFIYDLSCAAREEDIPSLSGDKRWNLDPAWFSEFPVKGNASFYFIRAHYRSLETPRKKFQMQGSRTFFTRFEITR